MAHERPFRFGVFGEGARSREALLDTARKAEEAGYATFLLRDHLIEEPFGHQLAPIAALATVASVTSRLRVASLVFSNDYRHRSCWRRRSQPSTSCQADVSSSGSALAFHAPSTTKPACGSTHRGVRVDRLEEALHVLKGLFAAGALTFAGKHYTVTNLDGFPKPVQRPHPPILVGAAGERMLSIAAREADIIGFQTVSTTGGVMSNDPSARLAETVTERVEHVRRVAGDRLRQIEFSMVVTVVITDQRRRAAEQFARDRQWSGISADQVLEMPSIFIGSHDQIVEQMQARRERYGFSYYVVFDHALERVAPIVARLAGK